uniref:Uncharacterized protein n=1 Tax=Laccaria amethystina TaxID=89243 RepID=A0A4D6SWI8_9AGAR|nr:hypothetical protein [Laccaria amethystina]QCG70063.1 hypothetical protein [Laccaria amethystina]
MNIQSVTNKIWCSLSNRNKNLWLSFVSLLDFLFLILVISFFINKLINIIIWVLETKFTDFNLDNIICFMSDNINNTPNISNTNTITQSTTTQIIHNDGSWSNAIRSLFIYGTGGYRLYLTRSGSTPGSRFMIVGGSIFVDNVGRFLANSINDPNYIRNYVNAWRISLDNNNQDTAIVNVSQGDSVDQAISQVQNQESQSTTQSISNNFIPDFNGLDDLSNKLTNNLMSYFTKFLEPVQVSYSQEELANQIYGISILLFALSVTTIVLLIFLLINIIIFTYSDKLINYFTNKYIKLYISINKKFIGIEIFLLGITILSSMYNLSYGIHFIATHPIVIKPI